MSIELEETSTPKMDFPCNDERIQKVKNQSQELRALTRDLSIMLNCKMNALFGCVPPVNQTIGLDSKKPDNWIDEISAALSDATYVCKDSFDRLSLV